MTTYYRVDGRKLTFGEYWRMSPDAFSFLIVAGMKLIGMPLKFNFAIPRPDRLFLVDFDELPKPARIGMKPLIRGAEKAGMELVFCHRLAVPEPHRLGAAALLIDESCETGLMVIYGKDRAAEENQMSCASRFADDTLAVTTTMKKTMVPVPDMQVERYPGASPATLIKRHREHMEKLEGEGLVPVPINPDRYEEFVLECELRYVDFHISRGVFVPMTDEELDEISGKNNDEEEE
jgi:hypothetical protein